MNLKRILYIDGSNLFGGMSDLLRVGEYIDYADLIQVIEHECGALDSIKFYGTYRQELASDNADRQHSIVAQRLFFSSASNHVATTFVKGYFSSNGKEKGIDMKMGVDIVHDAHLNSYDEALVMSGDDDFIYAILTARKIGKPVRLVAISSRYPFGAAHYVVTRTVLDIDGHFVDNVLPDMRGKQAAIQAIELRGAVTIHRAKRKTRRS